MTDALRLAGALLTLLVGAVHLQQYADLLSRVPVVGPSFLLNGIAGVVLSALLVLPGRRPRLLGAVGGILLAVASLVALALALAMTVGLFGYQEPELRGPVVFAIVVEAAAVLALAAWCARLARRPAEVRTRREQRLSGV